jgi:hypothetical protein
VTVLGIRHALRDAGVRQAAASGRPGANAGKIEHGEWMKTFESEQLALYRMSSGA